MHHPNPTPSYFIINNHRQYQPIQLSINSLEMLNNNIKNKQQQIKRLPISGRCNRILRDDKQNRYSIKQGQVLRVYYSKSKQIQNSYHTNQMKSLDNKINRQRQTSIKQSTLGFDIQRNLQSIDKSILLYQRQNYNQTQINDRFSNQNNNKQQQQQQQYQQQQNKPFQQILSNNSIISHHNQDLFPNQPLYKSIHYNNNQQHQLTNIEPNLVESSCSSSSRVIKNKKSRLKAYKQKLQGDMSVEDSVRVEIIQSRGLEQQFVNNVSNNNQSNNNGHQQKNIILYQTDQHIPHKLILNSHKHTLSQSYYHQNPSLSQQKQQQQQPILNIKQKINKLSNSKLRSKKNRNHFINSFQNNNYNYETGSKSMIVDVSNNNDNIVMDKCYKQKRQHNENYYQVKRSIIDDVIALGQSHKKIQLGSDNKLSQQQQQQNNNYYYDNNDSINLLSQNPTINQHHIQSPVMLPKTKLITHLLTPSQRQLPLQQQLQQQQQSYQKVSNLHPKPCQSLIFQPLQQNNQYRQQSSFPQQSSPYHYQYQQQHQLSSLQSTNYNYQSYNQHYQSYYQQQIKRRQQAQKIFDHLVKMKIVN